MPITSIQPASIHDLSLAFNPQNDTFEVRHHHSAWLTLYRVGYVPEHFLTPVLLAEKHGLFPAKVALHPCPSGTGQMLERLRNREIGKSLHTNPDVTRCRDWIDGRLGRWDCSWRTRSNYWVIRQESPSYCSVHARLTQAGQYPLDRRVNIMEFQI